MHPLAPRAAGDRWFPEGKQDELTDHFKLTQADWEAWNRERHGGDQSGWRPPHKMLIV